MWSGSSSEEASSENVGAISAPGVARVIPVSVLEMQAARSKQLGPSTPRFIVNNLVWAADLRNSPHEENSLGYALRLGMVGTSCRPHEAKPNLGCFFRGTMVLVSDVRIYTDLRGGRQPTLLRLVAVNLLLVSVSRAAQDTRVHLRTMVDC